MLHVVNIPDPEERLRLAQKLAFSVLHLHGAGWLPTSLSTDNICFLHPEIKDRTDIPDLSSYLPGYYESPTNTPVTGDVSSAKLILYIPKLESARSRSRRLFDMTGLGTILLAIGIWKQSSVILEEFEKALPPTKPCNGSYPPPPKWKDASVQKSWLEGLQVLCDVEEELGTIYRDIVVTCLSGDFGVRGIDLRNEKLEEAFSKLVAEGLDSILSSS